MRGQNVVALNNVMTRENDVMKMLIATVAFATAMASPASAQFINHQDVDVSVPQARIWVEPAPGAAFATAVIAPRFAPAVVRRDRFDVYASGVDPDLRMRRYVRRNYR
jgi:hypothetical protein